MAYDGKFRRQVINCKDSGHTFAEVHEAFGVTPRSYYGWKAEPEEKGKTIIMDRAGFHRKKTAWGSL
jgi:transposase